MLRRLSSVPKNYDWGTPDALSALRGEAPTGKPEAEAWFGTHPLSQCTIDDGGSVPFDRWLDDNGHDFPLLVKFLAASRPLSIQVHPDSATAVAGFDREESEGIPLDHPERTFRDPHPKPELLVCLSPSFDVLWGVQTPEALHAKFAHWGSDGLSPEAEELLHQLADAPLIESFRDMISGSDEVRAIARALADWGHEYSGHGTPNPTELEAHVISRTAHYFPEDPGIVVAAFMHARRLTRGEAVFVSPGEIHAYVDGFGLEIMLPSDNVVRAGLTTKHRDTSLFLSVATLRGSESVPTIGPGSHVITKSAAGDALPWELRRLSSGDEIRSDRDSLVLAEQGTLVAEDAHSVTPLDPGYAYFVGAGQGTLALRGDGVAWHVIPR